jgi:HEAT repeat protein
MGLLDLDERVRRRAVRGVVAHGDSLAGLFALRAVLTCDPSARVRAEAALRLGQLANGLARPWLLFALADGSALVRAAACRALASLGRGDELVALGRVLAVDSRWWVRRAAVAAVVRVIARTLPSGLPAGLPDVLPEEIPTPADAPGLLRGALGDPTWRVRLAAIRGLAVLCDDCLGRAAVLAPLPGAPLRAQLALEHLRALIEGDMPTLRTLASASSLRGGPPSPGPPGPLDDPDPAVAAARLALVPAGSIPAASLVALLAEPHRPLRALAIERLIARPEPGVLRAVLAWLDEPRVPYAVDAVGQIVDGVGPLADEVARSLIEQGALLPDGTAGAGGGGPALTRWAQRRLGLPLDEPVPAAPPLSSLALPGSDDPWTRGDALDLRAARAAALADPDPWVRRRATRMLLDGDFPSEERASLGLALASSPDPWIRLQAASLLGPRSAVGHQARPRGEVEATEAAGEALSDASLAALLGLTRDADRAVRAGAADAIEACPSLERRLTRVLLGQAEAATASLLDEQMAHQARPIGASARAAALTWLVGRSGRVDLLSPGAPGMIASDEPHLALLRSAFLEPDLSAASGVTAAPGVTAASAASARPADGRVPTFPLGNTGLSVSRLAVSGRYQLPGPALHDAAAAGINTFFWEPSYAHLTRFLRTSRGSRVIMAGSYHADAASIRRDVERALRLLRAERIEVFLLFWARSAARLEGEGLEALQRLKQQGKIGAMGFSTHLRDVALGGLDTGRWDALMTRHSAAHRGAERALFPRASALGTGVISFGNLCYGRLLSPIAGSEVGPARASDCYRFSLATPGVSLSVSAPRSERELREGLAALRSPALGDEARARLIAHGEAVYAQSQHFNALVRQAPELRRRPLRSIALDWPAPPSRGRSQEPPAAPLDDDRAAPAAALDDERAAAHVADDRAPGTEIG